MKVIIIAAIIFPLILIILIWDTYHESNQSNKKDTDYRNQLKSVEWLQKRTEILTKNGYVCKFCGSKNYLQVHHKYYLKYPNRKFVPIWDYPDDAFLVLCDKCHKEWHSKHTNKVYYKSKVKSNEYQLNK